MVGLHGVVRGATREMAKARDDDFSFAETRVARFQAASGLGKDFRLPISVNQIRQPENAVARWATDGFFA